MALRNVRIVVVSVHHLPITWIKIIGTSWVEFALDTKREVVQ